jgi:hypothetical protein
MNLSINQDITPKIPIKRVDINNKTAAWIKLGLLLFNEKNIETRVNNAKPLKIQAACLGVTEGKLPKKGHLFRGHKNLYHFTPQSVKLGRTG